LIGEAPAIAVIGENGLTPTKKQDDDDSDRCIFLGSIAKAKTNLSRRRGPFADCAQEDFAVALFSKEPERNLPAASEGRAYLDRGSKITGKISFEGRAQIDGEVNGEINAKDSLTIGESAVVTAQIRAVSLCVAGKVSGDIVATQRIELLPSAKLSGNITAPELSIQDGALFEGHCLIECIHEGAFSKQPVSLAAGRQKRALIVPARFK
jgi:cytoskeletal protein CcmA (bactofilin family)